MKRVVIPKPKTFLLHCPLYSNCLMVVTGTSYNAAEQRFCKKFGFKHEPEDDVTSAGRFIHFGTKDGLIWFRDAKPTGSLVAHEAFHATVHTLLKSGIRFCDESDEAFAYMIGWLVREIGRRIW